MKQIRRILGFFVGVLSAAFFVYCITRKVTTLSGIMLSLSVVLLLMSFIFANKARVLSVTFVGYCLFMLGWGFWYANIREGGPLQSEGVGLVFVFIPATVVYLIVRFLPRLRQ